MIETREAFENAIGETMDRMERAIRQRMKRGELPGWVTCECGMSLDGRFLEYHKQASPLHK